MVAPELRLSDEEIVQCLGFELSQKYKPATDLMELRHLTANFLLFPWRVPGVSFAYIDDEDRYLSSSGVTATFSVDENGDAGGESNWRRI
ncbi:uncharacterized protein EKO05_0006959 [Ascochyta rabiei]|uniref:uncharacterized protein n=1 Tax=Didymella rabiei TaxID=5454 RepID=UPI002204B9F5|nr:uncharacterized protein EKO05_0006959 [Ascochyta rabiei]UPX16566.1 hypothetical protein EKO05_0006959 [Ascochyta rabiei]